jgi:hypothetical protein
MDSKGFRKYIVGVAGERLKKLNEEWDSPAYDRNFHMYMDGVTEESWVKHERPYYNVWPIAMSLASDVKLDLPFSAVEIPFDALLLRFARGHELESLATSMLYWGKEFVQDYSYVQANSFHVGSPDFIYVRHLYKPNDNVEEWPAKNSDVSAEEGHLATQLIRLFVFIGLLSHDRDFVTPVVLSKDRAKYHATDDESVRKWLEDRAVRRGGRGFDVGKKLQEQKDKSPHWRNPHLALFWTGPGRTKPIIKMRSGSVIQRVSMAEVPTGYLGPEREGEDQEDLTAIYFIEAIGQDRIKIGKADNPESSLKTLQTGSPVELKLLGILVDKPSRELDLHTQFAADRIHGEWFHATERLREFIRHHAKPFANGT